MRARRSPLVTLVFPRAVLLGCVVAAAVPAVAQTGSTPIVFAGATLVPMDRERTVPNQTVVVRDGRIAAIGPADSVRIPPGATVIDARGRWLAPGLADMHIHILPPPAGPAAGFRDGPLYLANGVTTVLNLSGGPNHLALRERFAAGTVLGPTLYTAGRFVNEPVVTTPDEVEREVRSQAEQGVDVIKFREVVGPDLAPLTTRGLSREAYGRMMATARELALPLIGHAPNNLGLEAVLEERQSLAHVGYTLVASYFWPRETARFQQLERTGRWLLALLALVAASGWVAAAVLAVKRRTETARALALTAALATLVLAAALVGARALWDTDRIGSASRATVATAAGIGLWLGTVLLWWQVLIASRRRAPAARLHGAAAALLALGLAASAVYWVSLARRPTDRGLTALARDVARSGIWITPTIQVYRSAEVAGNPEMRYVRVPPWWESFRDPPPRRRQWARDMATFLQRVVGALHREGAPLLAGTDVMWPFVVPGFALHDELASLEASGLSRYEVLRTATVEPARFLNQAAAFGTIEVGKRADLLLLERNPLETLETLRTPLGVMVRGRWLPAAEVQAMLERAADAVP